MVFLWNPDPPQGFTREQSLVIIGRPVIPRFAAPQGVDGIAPPLNGIMAYEDLEIMGYEVDWFNLLWQQRIPLTINSGQVPSTQSNFPLLINDTYTELIGEVEAELRFTGADNIQLDYEIEKFDNITGELVAWFKKPSVSDSDVIRIYFDNPAAVDEQNSGAVWSDYNAIYHLNQTSFGSSSTLDSTSNNLDGTPQNMDGSNQVAGQIDGSLDFNGSNEIINVVDSTLLEPGSGAFTASVWVNPDSNSRMIICGKTEGGGSFDGWSIRFSETSPDRKIFIEMRDNGEIKVRGTLLLTIGVLQHVVFTYDGSASASGVKIFIDGVEDTTVVVADTLTGGISTNVTFGIATLGDGFTTITWEGIIDEVNIFAGVKTPDFITTIFNNQNDQNTFYATSAVEQVPSEPMGYEE